MSKENLELAFSEIEENASFNFDDLESKLELEINLQISDLQLLKEEEIQIGNEDNLGEVIKGVVWEQFMDQIAAKAGTDFIAENKGLTLDLRKDSHIQTTENFAKGKIAKHNTEIDYQERYDDWQSNFKKDENGNVETHKTRAGKDEATLVKGARKPFDNGRPSGSTEKKTDMDHTVSAAEMIRDPETNAHMTKEEQVAFANSKENLNEIDASHNRSKSDTSTTDWLDNPNSKGQKPKEALNMTDEQEKQLRKKDKEAREELEKRKKEGEKKSIEAGKKTRKEEAFRIGGKALRSAIMLLFTELIKEIISKLVKWLKSAGKNLNTLLEYIKEAVKSFISKLKTHLKNAGNSVLTTILTAIIGPVFTTIKKVWMLLKQGMKSVKDAINYLKNPDNQKQPLSIRLLETGKIIMAGLSAVSAILLGEAIEKSLMTIPFLAVEIPLLGSLANLIGLFAGGLTAGLIGAISINLINKVVEKKQKEFNLSNQVEKGNEILFKQAQLIAVSESKLANTKESANNSISARHTEAQDEIKNSLNNIFAENEDSSKNNDDSFDEMERIIKGLLD